VNRAIVLSSLCLVAAACDQLVTSPSRYTAVEVHAERRDGTGIGGVPLVLYTGLRIMGYDTTDAQGIARFVRVPEGPAYGVYAGEPEGYEFPERVLGGAPTNTVNGLNLYRDSTAVVRFRLLKVGPGTVTARVTDQAGAPVAGTDVELYRADSMIRRTKTAPDGRVIFFAVPFGLYGVRTPRPAEYRDLGESAFLSKDGLLIEDGVTTDGQLALQRCRGTINLRVADPTRGGASGLKAYLFIKAGLLDSARTASDGRVSFQTPMCNDFGVRIVGSGDWRVTPGRGSEFADGLIINRGTTRDVTLAVQYNSCRGAVRVTTAGGAGVAVPGATIVLYAAGSDLPVSTVAATGVATFSDLGCGPPERGVRIIPPSGWTVTPGGSDHVDALNVTSGGTLDVRFTLVRTSP
jgi:hypothetical protein